MEKPFEQEKITDWDEDIGDIIQRKETLQMD